ncbi:MAG: hypothetical protein HDT19_02455 [Oscillibacter sp.]|nr:hypothetical protein [Oscillibacter sp.]
MKTLTSKNGKTRHENRKIGIVILRIIIGLALYSAFCMILQNMAADRGIAKSLADTPEPEVCALCGNGNGTSYHAPVVVNLSTGETGEMQVYDPDPHHRSEIAKEQSTGTFSLLNIAGLTGYRDTSNHSSHVTLPKKREWGTIDPSYFCRGCRTLLADSATKGYAVADLYDLDKITIYAIKKGAEYMIRDYAVSISTEDEMKCLSIDVIGLLFYESE